MLLPYYITLFVSKLSMTFSVLYDCITCVTITYNITSHSLSKSKIKKNKIK